MTQIQLLDGESTRDIHLSRKTHRLPSRRTTKKARRAQKSSSDGGTIHRPSKASRVKICFPPSSSSTAEREDRAGEQANDEEKTQDEKRAKDNDAAYSEYECWIRGMRYRDPERAAAVKALYSTCIRAEWPVVFRFEDVKLNEKWVKRRNKHEGKDKGSFWRERMRVKEDRCDVVDGKVESKKLQGKKVEMTKIGKRKRGRYGKHLLVEQGRTKDVVIGSARGAKMYILPTSRDHEDNEKRTEEGKAWFGRMRDGASFVPMRRDKLAEILDKRLSLTTEQDAEDLDERDDENDDIEDEVLPAEEFIVTSKKRKQDELLAEPETAEFKITNGTKRKLKSILLKTGSAMERERLASREKKTVTFTETIKFESGA